ncbi:AvrPphF family type III effector [Pseudomonas indica]|jgi:hypothetical protein|uniref:AvrPphF family type III effector n=1 Tax=Pseudomonas indica TaxID=137658 RepID=UPI003FD14C60
MGICASSNRNVYSPAASPTSSPQRTSAPAGPSTEGGNRLTSIDQLSPHERQLFLESHDPMEIYKLKRDTPLYRTMPAEYLVDGRVSGNPNSGAEIRDYERLRPNPFGGQPGTADAYWPVIRNARELGPSLNVMAGPDAQKSTIGYHREGNINVEMRLGDFLERGGKVYGDESSKAGDGIETVALIVTLPEGESVPAKIVS